jgi:hypothetical protein
MIFQVRPVDTIFETDANTIGSLSSESKENHATRVLWEANHSNTRVVFPDPAGAETTVNGHLSMKASVKRGRGTIGWRS